MIFTVPWSNKKPRTLAVDKDDNVWVGGGVDYTAQDQPHQKVDGHTGQLVQGTLLDADYGGYGGLVDGYGYLWSSGYKLQPTFPRGGLMRVNPTTLQPDTIGNTDGDYGIGIDPKTQRIWYASRPQSQMAVYNWYRTLHAD